jgi:hypothetical protein
MNAEFNWWLLIVGLVVGAGLVWLVIADWSRREEDLSEDERAAESEWIADALMARGETIDVAAAEEVLALHREYLRQAGWLTAEDGTETANAAPANPTRWSDPEPPLWQAHPIADPDARDDEAPSARTSVRARPVSPRGAPAGMESEPPAS